MTAITKSQKAARIWAILALLATMIFWGSATVFLRSTALSMSPESSLALRYALLSIINIVGLALLGTWRIPRADWPRFAISGLVGMAGYNWFVNQGYALVPAGLGTIITMVEPLMIAFLAWVLLREQLSRAVFTGLAVSLIGAVVLFWPDIASAEPSVISYKGVSLLVLCCLCWAFYTILAKPLLQRYDAFTVTAITMLIAAPLLISGANEPLHQLALRVDSRQWFEIAYLVIPNGILGTLLWNYGSQQLPSSATGAFLYLIPVIAVIAGALILGEIITIPIILGGALMLAGVAIAQFGARLFR